MNDLRGSLSAKICALFVISLLAAGAIFCAFGAGYLYSGGAYDGTGSYFDTSVCRSYVYRDADSVYYLWTDDPTGDWIKSYNAANSNFGFALYKEDAPNTVILSANIPEKPGYSSTIYIDDYIIRGYVSSAMSAQDEFSFPYSLYCFLLPQSGALALGFVLCVLCGLVLLIFLCVSAGHRRNEEHVLPNYLDRMPLDIWLTLAVLGVIFCLSPLNGYSFSFTIPWLLLCGVGLLGIFLLALMTVLTFATRVKLGRWWRNTIIYKSLRVLWHIVRGIWSGLIAIVRALPLTWRTSLILIGFGLFQSILTLSSQYSPTGFFLLLGMDVAAFWMCSRASLDLGKLREAGARLAAGDADYRVDTRRMPGALREHGEHLNSLGGGIVIAVDERMKSERMKTELITNVSHDIKTPLTSILNYVDLLQKDPTPEEQREYLAVLDRQAKRLKKLTEDLVEASKAATGNLQVTLERTDLCELLRQAAGEYGERLSANDLTQVLTTPEEPIFVNADGRLLWRVIDNLLGNACKYAQPGTRVYLDVRRVEEHAVLTARNISRQQLNIDPEELTERFVRGDSARNTEGSGLGLNIARSLTELQHGRLEIIIDGDLFKATVSLPAIM